MVLRAGSDQMGGHRDFARAQRPDVQVMDRLHARLSGQEGLDLVLVDAPRHCVHRRLEGVAQQPERTQRHHHGHQQRRGRVQPAPVQPQHAQAGQHRRQRHRGVRDQVQEGAAPVHVLAVTVAVAIAHEPGRAQIHGDADGGDDDDRQRRDLRRVGEAAHRFPAQRAAEPDQQQRIAQRREQGGAAPAVGVAAGGRALGHDRRAPGQRQAQHIAEVVQRIGQQRQRIGIEAVTGFQRGVGEIDQRRDGERAGAGGEAVAVTVMATVRRRVRTRRMRRGLVVVVVVMIVIVLGHARMLARSPKRTLSGDARAGPAGRREDHSRVRRFSSGVARNSSTPAARPIHIIRVKTSA